MLDHKELLELLEYNKHTGVFIWKISPVGWLKKGTTAGTKINESRYSSIKINGIGYKAHRLAYFYVKGVWPLGEIDHINGNRYDNSFINLRDVTRIQNNRNAARRTDNKSGLTGVNWSPSKSKWVSQIGIGKRQMHIGYYTDFFLACCARKSAELIFNYNKNHGREAVKQC